MKKLVTLIVCLTFAAASQAVVYNLEATLSGTQEVPPNASPGTGSATITYDDFTEVLSWAINWSGLQGTVTAAHFHGPAAAGVNAGVQVHLPLVGNSSISSAGITGGQASALLAGNWYINVHTDQFPGGEIRGQVYRTPDAGSTIALFAAGLLGLVALRRRFMR